MSAAASLTDVDITKSSQSLAELLNLGLVDLLLLALLILVAALLLGMEAQVLKQDNLAVLGAVHGLLDLLADAVVCEGHALAEQLLELGNNRLETVLRVRLAIRAAEVGHQNDGLSSVLDGMLDGGQSTDNTLVVGDVLVRIERDVEVDLCSYASVIDRALRSLLVLTYTDQDALTLEVDIANGELVGERHGCGMSTVVAAGSAELFDSFKTAIEKAGAIDVGSPKTAN